MKGCILWGGPTNNKGYGVVSIDGHGVLVHRVAFKMANPSVRIDRALVLHRCDTRLCFNAKHLFRGSAQDNTDDMMRKGRWIQPRHHLGHEHVNAKLSRAAVSEIRRKHRPGNKWGASALAEKYGVTRQTISNVVAGRTHY